MEDGIDIVDSTVTGMGRGAGNTITEQLLMSRAGDNTKLQKLNDLLSFVEGHAIPLQKKLGWGPNSYYALAAKLSIHPTYVQTLLERDTEYSPNKIINLLFGLGNSSTTSFSEKVLFKAINGSQDAGVSLRDLKESCIPSFDAIILVGPGEISYNEINQIRIFCETNMGIFSCGSFPKSDLWKLDGILQQMKVLIKTLCILKEQARHLNSFLPLKKPIL